VNVLILSQWREQLIGCNANINYKPIILHQTVERVFVEIWDVATEFAAVSGNAQGIKQYLDAIVDIATAPNEPQVRRVGETRYLVHNRCPHQKSIAL